jgi:hypothetical protein
VFATATHVDSSTAFGDTRVRQRATETATIRGFRAPGDAVRFLPWERVVMNFSIAYLRTALLLLLAASVFLLMRS